MSAALSSVVSVECACGKKLKAPASLAGKKSRCPACKAVVGIPAAAPAVAASATHSQPTSTRPGPRPTPQVQHGDLFPLARESEDDILPFSMVSEPATAPLKMPPPPPRGMVASRTEDPGPIGLAAGDVPREPKRVAPAKAKRNEPAPAADSDPLNAIYDLANDPAAAAAANESVLAPPPLHTAATAANSPAPAPVPTRSTVPVPRFPTGPRPGGVKQQVDLMAAQGSFWVGLGVSAGAVVGAVIVWFLAGYLLPLLAVPFVALLGAPLIGLAAGLGMQIGQKGYSSAGGLAAAALTVVGIIAGRIAIVVGFVISTVVGTMGDIKNEMEKLQFSHQMVINDYRAQGIDPDAVDFEERDEAETRAAEKVASLSKEERKALLRDAEAESVRTELKSLINLELHRLEGDANLNPELMDARLKKVEGILATIPQEQWAAERDRLRLELRGLSPKGSLASRDAGVDSFDETVDSDEAADNASPVAASASVAESSVEDEEEDGSTSMALGALAMWALFGGLFRFKGMIFGVMITLSSIALAYRTASGSQGS